ncbi:uncharacterized protein LOC143863324 [Tasmannia lanceolata]|uniref:uncharacterized protein LOC143863324 n=1 Tax=Tasmannia lanceolata TaxID=3420 RepID=UPI004063370A
MVDRLSKYGHFICLAHPYSAVSIAQLFMDNIFKLHGMITSIVSDRDPIFLSNFWTELFKLQGVQLNHSSTYHPQSDGQTQVVNRCLENYLRCFTGERPRDWAKWVPLAEWCYNTNSHSSTGMTPYEAVYGSPPPRLLTYVKGTTKVPVVEEVLGNIAKGSQTFSQVLWALQGATEDWNIAYKLELSKEASIHPVCHVSYLKKKLGQQILPQSQLPPVTQEGWVQPGPAAIIDRRVVKRGHRAVSEVLVQWKGVGREDTTWESFHKLMEKFPDCNLEDKVV